MKIYDRRYDTPVIILNFLNNVGCELHQDRGRVDIGRWHRCWIGDSKRDTSLLEVMMTELRGLGDTQVMILNFL
jgi:hypothetical protein